MILDTSAVVAILQGEPGSARLAAAVEEADTVRISVASVLEAALVLGPRRGDLVDEFLEITGAELVPVDTSQLSVARGAHLRYGRGSGSPARLNYGHCFSYALATTSGEPLLFVGDDFSHTDLEGP